MVQVRLTACSSVPVASNRMFFVPVVSLPACSELIIGGKLRMVFLASIRRG